MQFGEYNLFLGGGNYGVNIMDLYYYYVSNINCYA